MKKRILIELGIVLLTSLVVACSGNSVSPPATSATPAIYVLTPPARVSSPLVGSYKTTITKQDGLFLISSPAVEFREVKGL
jgi:hypothetical protein